MVKMCLIQILSFCAFAHQLLRTLPCLLLHDIRLVWIPTHLITLVKGTPNFLLQTLQQPTYCLNIPYQTTPLLQSKKHPTSFPKYSNNQLTSTLPCSTYSRWTPGSPGGFGGLHLESTRIPQKQSYYSSFFWSPPGVHLESTGLHLDSNQTPHELY